MPEWFPEEQAKMDEGQLSISHLIRYPVVESLTFL